MTELRLKHIATSIRIPATSGDYVGLENVQSGTGRLLVDELVADPAGAIAFRRGDVLFGKLRPYLRKVLVAPSGGRCSSEFLVLRPLAADSRFLSYLLLSGPVTEWCVINSAGSKMPRTEWDVVGQARVTAPDIGKQRAIADYLDRETARIDALIEKKQRQAALLRDRFEALVAELTGARFIVDVEAPHPGGWRRIQLRRLFAITRYGIGEAAHESGRIGVLGMANVRDRGVSLEPIGYVDAVDPALLLRQGDLLFNRTNSRALVGKVGYVVEIDEPTTIASYLVLIRVTDLVDAKYLSYLLNTAEVLGVARSMALPSIGQANLNPSRYGGLRVIIPRIEQQIATVQVLDEARARFEDAQRALARVLDLLVEKRQALITAAVTGQIPIPGAA